MVDGINLLNASSPLQAANSTGLHPHASVEQPEHDFMENLSDVFEKATKRLEQVPGMDGVYCVANPVNTLDITVVDPQSIPGDNSASSIV